MPDINKINYQGALLAAQSLGIEEGFINILSQIESLAGRDDPEPGHRSPERRAFAENNAPHFTFFTNRDDVAVPDHLLARFPETITIALQHQFSDLRVESDRFVVSMNFNRVPFDITVPYDAIIQVTDAKQPGIGLVRTDYAEALYGPERKDPPRDGDKPGGPGNGSGKK